MRKSAACWAASARPWAREADIGMPDPLGDPWPFIPSSSRWLCTDSSLSAPRPPSRTVFRRPNHAPACRRSSRARSRRARTVTGLPSTHAQRGEGIGQCRRDGGVRDGNSWFRIGNDRHAACTGYVPIASAAPAIPGRRGHRARRPRSTAPPRLAVRPIQGRNVRLADRRAKCVDYMGKQRVELVARRGVPPYPGCSGISAYRLGAQRAGPSHPWIGRGRRAPSRVTSDCTTRQWKPSASSMTPGRHPFDLS